MNQNLQLTTGCALALLLCACNGQKGERSVEEITSSLHIEQPDTSLYATLKAVNPDSLAFASQYDDESFSCTYEAAKSQSYIYGSLTEGHRYAIVLNPNHHDALKLFNITELSGQWFFDNHPESGLTFTASGALNSINSDNVSFRKWKFYNGRIILYYVEAQDLAEDAHHYKADTTEIVSLSAEALTFRFRGETLSCHRQKEAIKVKFNF